MAEVLFCDRCNEPLDPGCYTELYIMPAGGKWSERYEHHHRGMMCMACYKVVAETLQLPLAMGEHRFLHPGLINNAFGTLWKRLWGTT